MNNRNPKQDTSPAQADWNARESVLMRFEQSWRDKEHPPSIALFLADSDSKDRTLLLIELAKIDLEHHLQGGKNQTVDDYFERYPELASELATKLELLEYEVGLRNKVGSKVTREELLQRYPTDLNLVDRLLNSPHRPQAAITTHGSLDAEKSRSGHSLDSLLHPGAMINQYRIDRQIGSGAFSVVFAAEDTKLHRKVAIKVLRDHVATNQEIRIRMLREAQAAASLQHENVVAVYETGKFEDLDFIASRLIEGESLEERLSDTELSASQSAKIIYELSSALEAAHEQGIVHRDLKPANIMLEGDTPLVVDFGLAHLADASVQLTMEGDLVGTPTYMAPEQALGKGWQGDPRSDIYSLGAVLFRMVCHRVPFTGSAAQVISQVIHREPPSPKKLNQEIDRDLQTIILKCLEKEPASRYLTAASLRDDLSKYLAGQPISARPTSLAVRTLKWARRRPAIASLAVALMLLTTFSLGVLSQLNRVGKERDRAQSAELDTQQLLAQSAADAGLLSIARGNFQEAIEHFESSLNRRSDSPPDILLRLVESHVALRQISDAETYLTQVAETHDAEKIADVSLWMSELAMEGVAKFGDPLENMRAAIDHPSGLLEADQEYALGILSKTSLEAVDHFRRAIKRDPYHHRSQRMLVTMLLSLAQFDEALVQLATTRQLYPNDNDFLLIESLVRAGLDDLESARELLQASTLSDTEKNAWTNFCVTLREVVFAMPFDSSLAELDSLKLAELSKRFQAEFQPLIRKRGWRFPPTVAQKFEDLPQRIAQLEITEKTQAAAALQTLVDIHPEGSLAILLAGLQIGLSYDEAESKEEAIKHLIIANDLFASATETSGLLNGTREFAWKGIFATSLSLGFSHKYEIKKYHRQLADASLEIDPSMVQPRYHRVFSLVLLNVGREDLAARWIDAWIDSQGDEGPELAVAIWHRAIVYRRQENWLAALKTSRRVLEFSPDDQNAKDLVKTASNHLRSAMDEGDSKTGAEEDTSRQSPPPSTSPHGESR